VDLDGSRISGSSSIGSRDNQVPQKIDAHYKD